MSIQVLQMGAATSLLQLSFNSASTHSFPLCSGLQTVGIFRVGSSKKRVRQVGGGERRVLNLLLRVLESGSIRTSICRMSSACVFAEVIRNECSSAVAHCSSTIRAFLVCFVVCLTDQHFLPHICVLCVKITLTLFLPLMNWCD